MNASACRRACSDPSLPSVMIFSAIGRISFAFGSVVWMRPWRRSSCVRLRNIAVRWPVLRSNLRPLTPCRMCAVLGRCPSLLVLGSARAAVAPQEVDAGVAVFAASAQRLHQRRAQRAQLFVLFVAQVVLVVG